MWFFSFVGIAVALFGGYALLMSKGSGGYGCFGLVALVLGIIVTLAGIISSFANGNIFSGIFSIILVVLAIAGVIALAIWINTRD